MIVHVLVAFASSVGWLSAQAERTPVKLILDTDIGGGACQDVDDVANLCIAHALADLGEAELLAVIQDSSPIYGAGVISVINTYYGRPSLPIGAYKGTDLSPNASYQSFQSDLVTNWPSSVKNSSQVRRYSATSMFSLNVHSPELC